MTYGSFKYLVKGLLTGDNALPSDENVMLSMLSYGFNMVANEAEALHLLTLNRNKDILRKATGDYLMRNPKLPVHDSDALDIDNELCYPLAEFVAGSLSRDKKKAHDEAATKLIMHYNGKIESILSSIRKQSDGTLDLDMES
jgi:hypothetical protein